MITEDDYFCLIDGENMNKKLFLIVSFTLCSIFLLDEIYNLLIARIFSLPRASDIYKQIGLCGNETFVTQIRDFLVSKLSVKKVKVIQTEIHLWQVTWASTKDIDTICNYIYRYKL